MTAMRLPLFPLNTVLFPGGPLPLRLFETRYLDMISRCMKNDSGFGVILIREGTETGVAVTHEIGTIAKIVDWYQGSDGLLGITAVGEARFELRTMYTENDGLNVGEVDLLAPEPSMPLPAEYEPFAHILEGVLEDLGHHYQTIDKDYNDATWVGSRLAEILPIGLEQKQFCLELRDPLQRLDVLRPLLKSIRTESTQ